MSYLNVDFQLKLQKIREDAYEKDKLKRYRDWITIYKEDLDILYNKFSTYYVLSYNDFIQLVYDSSNHKSKV